MNEYEMKSKYDSCLKDDKWYEEEKARKHKQFHKTVFYLRFTAKIILYYALILIPFNTVLSIFLKDPVGYFLFNLLGVVAASGMMVAGPTGHSYIMERLIHFKNDLGLDPDGYFEYWYRVTYTNGDKIESDSAKFRRLKKEESERKKYIEFYEQLKNDKEFREAFFSIDK